MLSIVASNRYGLHAQNVLFAPQLARQRAPKSVGFGVSFSYFQCSKIKLTGIAYAAVDLKYPRKTVSQKVLHGTLEPMAEALQIIALVRYIYLVRMWVI